MADPPLNPEDSPAEPEATSTGQALAAIRKEREYRSKPKVELAPSPVHTDAAPADPARFADSSASADEGWIAVAAQHDGWDVSACLAALRQAQIQSQLSAHEVQVRRRDYDAARNVLKQSRATLWKRRNPSNMIVDAVFGAMLGILLATVVPFLLIRGAGLQAYIVPFLVCSLIFAPLGALLLAGLRR